jgi:hypothetical protein
MIGCREGGRSTDTAQTMPQLALEYLGFILLSAVLIACVWWVLWGSP